MEGMGWKREEWRGYGRGKGCVKGAGDWVDGVGMER